MSDVIMEFHEDTSFFSQLSMMFPPDAPAPEWDKKGEYTIDRLVIYAVTHRDRLLKVGKKMTLRDVCKASKGKAGEPRDGLELQDGSTNVIVVPKGGVEAKWIEEFKRNRDS